MSTRNVFHVDLETGKEWLETVEHTPPVPDPIEQRRDAYQQISTDEVFEAILEHFEGRPERLAKLMERRAAIKAQYPKK